MRKINSNGFMIMPKPVGALCNQNCEYCYYLDKKDLYPNKKTIMTDKVLRAFTFQYIESCPSPVIFSWHGGEPLLAGLDFFEQAVYYQKSYGGIAENLIQTNGQLINDEWANFFLDKNFLVGISIDGPTHDKFRKYRSPGASTLTPAMLGLFKLRDYGVKYNILCTVNSENVKDPLNTYRFLTNYGDYIQFVPIAKGPGAITGQEFGNFLMSIFREWVTWDVGTKFVQIFDVALNMFAGLPPTVCHFQETCGEGMVLEWNGDLYCCDHYVNSYCKLGNILETPLKELVKSKPQQYFGNGKNLYLSQDCYVCPVYKYCRGECPKNRKKGKNLLCEGYYNFFTYIRPYMEFMVNELKHKRPPSNIMKHTQPSFGWYAPAGKNQHEEYIHFRT